MEILEAAINDIVVVEPRGRIDSGNAREFGERINAHLRSGTHRLVLDFKSVVYISSAGFRALLIAGKLTDELSGRLVLCGISGEVKRLFDLAAFTELFTICPTRDEGIAKAV